MVKENTLIKWAPRIKPHTIRCLYEADAKRIVVEALIDQIGYNLLARCEAIHRVTHRLCPDCGNELDGAWDQEGKGRKISCKDCKWHSTWGSYHRSYKGKRLHGGRAFSFFEAYLERFPKCKDAQHKMLEIDRLIHGVHESANKLWTSPGAQPTP